MLGSMPHEHLNSCQAHDTEAALAATCSVTSTSNLPIPNSYSIIERLCDVFTNLCDEIVVEEDVGWSGKQRVVALIDDLGLQVGILRQLGHALVEELREEVDDGDRDLVVGVIARDRGGASDVEHGARDAFRHLRTSRDHHAMCYSKQDVHVACMVNLETITSS